jgi:hypothetical protein
MLRLGSPADQTREMDLDDIFLSRLKLLILMATAYLKGWPMGEFRCRAMYASAQHMESESIDLGRLSDNSPYSYDSAATTGHDIVFYQRVKLLAVMIKAVARGYPMGDHRKAAMQVNLDIICRTLPIDIENEEMAFLKVA